MERKESESESILATDHWPTDVAGDWVFRSPGIGITRWTCHDNATNRREKVQRYFVMAFLHHGSFQVRGPRGSTLADANTVALFNPDEPFTTSHPHGCGDHGSSLVIDRALLRAMLLEHDPGQTGDDPQMRAPGCTVTPRAYLLQRLLLERAARREDALAVEETAVRLAGEVLRGVLPAPRPARTAGRAAARELAEAVRGLLVRHYRESLRLEDIAGAVERSTYHVCRTFRAEIGVSLHRYLTRLRLRGAFEMATEPGSDLTDVALEVGFSSHSHFTAAFRQEFGVPPSQARRLMGKTGAVRGVNERWTAREAGRGKAKEPPSGGPFGATV